MAFEWKWKQEEKWTYNQEDISETHTEKSFFEEFVTQRTKLMQEGQRKIADYLKNKHV